MPYRSTTVPGDPRMTVPVRWRRASLLGHIAGATEQAGREAGPVPPLGQGDLAGQGIQHRQPRGLGQLLGRVLRGADRHRHQAHQCRALLAGLLHTGSETVQELLRRWGYSELGMPMAVVATKRDATPASRAQARRRSSLPGI